MRYFRTNSGSDLLASLKRPPVKALLTAAMAFAVASPVCVHAQEWRFEPIVSVGAEYDDNARLDIRTDQEVKLEGVLAEFEAIASYSSDKTEFSIQPRVRVSRYSDEPLYDAENYYLQSRYSYISRLGQLGFRASYAHEDVRRAERAISDIDIDDPDEITDDDTGRILLSGNRDKFRISPKWGYRWSDVSMVTADIDYSIVEYEDVFAGLLDDYTDARLNLGYRRDFSSVNAGLLTLTARNFDTTASTVDTNGYGLLVGFDRALSEKMQLTALVGVENTELSNGDTEPETVGSITLLRNLETIRVLAQYRRSVAASGAGRLELRDSVNVNFRRRLSEKLSAGLGVRAYQSRAAGLVTFDDRDYIQLQASFLWYLSKSMVIETDYRYTIIDRSGTVGERANANQVNVWFVYQPRTIPKL
jgi:hypothetical protein